MPPITVALDAMGGDHAPREIVAGALEAMRSHPVKIVFVGDRQAIEEHIQNQDSGIGDYEILHTPQVISMEESPKDAIEQKPDASITLAAQLVGEGKADALVSAGSTGSVVLSAAKYIPRIYGVRRTAIATVYPTLNENKRQDNLALMVDVGANVRCSAEELVQFAIMGSVYVADIRGITDPKVALLNIGEEATKGGEKMQEAYRLLEKVPGMSFSGNIEGKDILRGIVDVIVTEGFVGNIVVKTLEGAAKTISQLGKMAFKARLGWKVGLFFLRKGLAILREVTDYTEYGGAPLLGFDKIVIIAHGRSNAKAVANAIKLASKCVRDDVCGVIAKKIRTFETEPGREYGRLSDEF